MHTSRTAVYTKYGIQNGTSYHVIPPILEAVLTNQGYIFCEVYVVFTTWSKHIPPIDATYPSVYVLPKNMNPKSNDNADTDSVPLEPEILIIR